MKLECNRCGDNLLKNGPTKYDVNGAKLVATHLTSIDKTHVVPVIICGCCKAENTLPFAFMVDSKEFTAKPDTEGYVAWESEYFKKYLKYEGITRDEYLQKFK